MRTPRYIALCSAALVVLGLSACSAGPPAGSASPGGTAPASRDIQVVVTTPILGSIASAILACANQGSVEVLMPNGSDPHDFTPSSAQVASLLTADLVVANGLGLESGMSAALEGARWDGATIWEAGPQVDPIPFGESTGHAHEGEDHAHEGEDHAHEGEDHAHEGEDHAHEGGSLDPHIWFDMSRMARVAALMGQQFQQAAGGTPEFGRCGEQVADQITQAETEVRATLESVPVDRRILVTDHEALGYLAAAYGFEIAGAVIPSISTLAEPSSADLAKLAEVIRAEGVPAIFANLSQPTQLAQAVAAESGTEVVVVPLYVESLGKPGSPAADYIGLMRENARLIASALAP